MFRRLRHFTSLQDVLIFLQVIILWSIVPLLLLFPLERILQLLTPPSRLPSRPVSSSKIILLVNYWFRLTRFIARNSCLKRSLVLYHLFNRHGIPVKICIGIKQENGRFIGHSWVESKDGSIEENRDVDDFVVMYTYPVW